MTTPPGELIGLVDGDILAYEIGFAADAYWKHYITEQGLENEDPPPWYVVENMLEKRIPDILSEAGVGQAIICFTGKRNFRNHIARTQPYKEREGRKPYHHKNIRLWIHCNYPCQSLEGLEADDIISLYLSHAPEKYICITRDKDLRQVPGWHYGWEVHNQASFGPKKVDDLGELALSKDRKKIVGTGERFLHAQILMGDRVDTIPGVPEYGPVATYNALKDCETREALEEAVASAYRAFYGLDWLDRMRETGRLVYMTRQVKNNKAKLYNPSFLNREDWIDLETGEIG